MDTPHPCDPRAPEIARHRQQCLVREINVIGWISEIGGWRWRGPAHGVVDWRRVCGAARWLAPRRTSLITVIWSADMAGTSHIRRPVSP